jgi:hypothetical protein
MSWRGVGAREMIRLGAMTLPDIRDQASSREPDRMGSRGLRPVTLPHHRTCGSASGG